MLPSALTGFEVGEELSSAHRTAHAVMMSTYEGVVTDLDDFAASLEQAVADAEQADELTQSQLSSLGSINEGPSNADARQQEARDTHLIHDEDGKVSWVDKQEPGQP